MPIIIRDWFWSQTNDEVKIVLPFKTPKNHSNIDTLTSRSYLKLHCAPYFWECFLLHEIKDDSSKCQVFDGKVQLTLKKCEPDIEWVSLEKELSSEEKMQIRNDAVKVNQELYQQKLKETITKREEKKKEEIMTATSRDVQARADYEAMIESAKDEIKQKLKVKGVFKEPQDSIKSQESLSTLLNSKSRETSEPLTNLEKEKPTEPSKKKVTFDTKPEVKPTVDSKRDPKVDSKSKTDKKIDDTGVSFFKIKTPLGPPIKPEPKNREPEYVVNQEVPLVRPTTEINVNFTPRRFITPKRESRNEDENEWLLKQKDMKKAMGFDEDDLLPEEKNPEYLKKRGDQFFEQKNFRAAVAAYTAAIQLTNKWPDLYLNRSAAHFQLENYQRCIEDCSRGYELLVPVCDANLESRKNCLARRGAALARVGLIKQAFDEIVAALKLDPGDAVLRRDAEMLRCKLERGDG